MLEVLLIVITEAFKASGAFWALSIAHKFFLMGLQNGGLHLFLFLPAIILIGVAFIIVVDCGSIIYHAFLVETDDNNVTKNNSDTK